MHFLRRLRIRLLRWEQKVLYSMIKTKVIGADPADISLKPDVPVIYAQLHPSHAEQMVIDHELRRLGLDEPLKRFSGSKLPGWPFFGIYRRPSIPFRRGVHPAVPSNLMKQVEWMLADDSRDIQVMPIRVFWGRSPEREQSFLRIWLQSVGSFGGRLMTFSAILFNGRNTFVHMSLPLSLRELAAGSDSPELVARKLARVLRVHNRQVTNSVLGPELSHRKTLVHQIPNRPMVRQVINEEVEKGEKNEAKLRAQALKYADEIASNISYTNVRFLDVVLTWVWNKIYQGTEVHNLNVVKEVSKDNTIIYVPCHRSHIDYLLLSYVLYYNGLQIPHIAAGINLNMPVVGSILRRGGAFFMRRTFRDNRLYAAVFDEYLHSVFTHGFSAEYFVEGGRSRTGRTLTPKAGMLAMTLRSYLRDSRKPITLIPVYTGYEKVFEERSYLGELRGQAKKKESLLGTLSTVRSLRKPYGRVRVTFGDPIHLSEYLDQQHPGWLQESYDDCAFRPDWAPVVTERLATRVTTEINKAASVNPINLVAFAILSTPRQAMDEKQLIQRMEAYHTLLANAPYSHLTTLPSGNGQDWLAHAESLESVSRSSHPMGDLIQTNDRQAVTLTYYRNNILHIFALPALLACLIVNQRRCSEDCIRASCRILYPFLKAELFLYWDKDDLDNQITLWLETLIRQGYIAVDEDSFHINPDNPVAELHMEGLAEHMMQTLQRYFLTLSRLTHQDSGQLTPAQLEEQSTQLAQRISLLYGINAPEFFDKALFRTLIQRLVTEGMVRECKEHGTLLFSEELEPLTEVLERTLNSQLRQTILNSL
ncbi:MAG: glycerol-3-phosphate 1-O-acyltransferase [Oceanospirillaceae bacterium]|nr:glycerol-3-phosphate 1-O-acyltransferase [Oceanospirillaceae bacterium]|tara:strand:- start:969 stop:3425 length:2457 start_codon:yes stop_codon:yes gene_type:complete